MTNQMNSDLYICVLQKDDMSYSADGFSSLAILTASDITIL